jgi:hypothetical protein
MQKPKMTLTTSNPNREGNGFELIEKAASILSVNGLKQESQNIHQEATTMGYEFHHCLRLLKKYMDV